MFGLSFVAGLLRAVPWFVWAGAAVLAYNVWIENPRIERDARQGCLSVAERAALEAELAEIARQRDAALRAAGAWRASLEAHLEQQREIDAAAEQERKDYGAGLAAKNRSCALTNSDIKFLRRRENP